MDGTPLSNDAFESIRARDAFSRWMGIEILELAEGCCRLRMAVRPEMLNGLGIVHGGIAFSLADSAFGYAANSRSMPSVALEADISFIKAVHADDILTAEAREVHDGRSTGLYVVTIRNQRDQTVALFKGTCFRTGAGTRSPSL